MLLTKVRDKKQSLTNIRKIKGFIFWSQAMPRNIIYIKTDWYTWQAIDLKKNDEHCKPNIQLSIPFDLETYYSEFQYFVLKSCILCVLYVRQIYYFGSNQREKITTLLTYFRLTTKIDLEKPIDMLVTTRVILAMIKFQL